MLHCEREKIDFFPLDETVVLKTCHEKINAIMASDHCGSLLGLLQSVCGVSPFFLEWGPNYSWNSIYRWPIYQSLNESHITNRFMAWTSLILKFRWTFQSILLCRHKSCLIFAETETKKMLQPANYLFYISNLKGKCPKIYQLLSRSLMRNWYHGTRAERLISQSE